MSEEPERKLVAILAAATAALSRPPGREEAGTPARLDQARRGVIDPAIAMHRGRIFKVIGSGILAEFPSAVLALRAAVGIQTELAARNRAVAAEDGVVLRIGVHQGEAVVAGGDLLGDGVITAARIVPLAPPGGICVSARVHEDSTGKLPLGFDDLGEHTLRDIARPVRVLRVLLHGEPPPAPAAPAAERTPPRAGDAERTLLGQAPPQAMHVLVVSSPGRAERRVALDSMPFVIGRQPPCGLLLDGREVSRRHCQIHVADGHAVVTDLASTNGTFVDGQRIAAPTRLLPGMRIGLGAHALLYECQEPGADPEATGIAPGGRAPPMQRQGLPGCRAMRCDDGSG